MTKKPLNPYQLALKRAIIRAPENPEEWSAWRNKIQEEAAQERSKLGDVLYDQEAQSWASRAYAMGFVMLWDHELIDHRLGKWKVDRYCDRVEQEFGGYDMVCLWCNYPLTGIDDRNQFAYYGELPGGLDGLKDAVARFHRRGVRVLLDHKPWVLGVPDGFNTVEEAFVDLVMTCNLDGLFLDVQGGPQEEFRAAMAEKAGNEKIFISEAPATMNPFGSEVGCWVQMSDDSTAPAVFRHRLLDRNMIIYESRRYFHDPITEIQRGWMNGGGQVIWENVFGYWSEYSERSKSWMRLMFPAQRRFAEFFLKGQWDPHTGGAVQQGIYVSQWEYRDASLWTVVNRRGHTVEGGTGGSQVKKGILWLPEKAGCIYVDVISGQEFTVIEKADGEVLLGGYLQKDGLAGILAVDSIDDDLKAFLQAQRLRFASANWKVEDWKGEHRKTSLPHVLREVEQTKPAKQLPDGMVPIENLDGFMVTRYRMRECGYIAGAVDEHHVYDNNLEICNYSRKARVSNVALDAFPVTNSDFLSFLKSTGYTPGDSRNFLRHWTNGQPPERYENHPVVYISLRDARAYAAWAGKRLPTEEEWQRAAQGNRNYMWPWGDDFSTTHCNGDSTGTMPVDAYPSGRTPSGLWDMCGNVWEMTESERFDGHTRYQILKGGSWYVVNHSGWFFDHGAQPADWGAKHILLCDAWDRCATIGFRCAVDLERQLFN
ncbi:MAG: SUMF1/EgtB/PvdO family nonheme iron enzyme [Candidatus Marinimicrobia bacterium]|nr:SUMF1/EgtB/PvdO family nonheme iron enzyme [Candidatus Neomarinimicrobiota bacterium]